MTNETRAVKPSQDPKQGRLPSRINALMYAPITRIDEEKRIVEGIVSSEAVDSFGTIFDYAAMKRAMTESWMGNVREQHDAKKAVGRKYDVTFDDTNKQVWLRTRISKGAEDTWQKVLDGTLSGYSIGAYDAKTPERRAVGEKSYPVYTDFKLAEVSLVDAPSNPDAAQSGLVIYRAQAMEDDEATIAVSDVLDLIEDAVEAALAADAAEDAEAETAQGDTVDASAHDDEARELTEEVAAAEAASPEAAEAVAEGEAVGAAGEDGAGEAECEAEVDGDPDGEADADDAPAEVASVAPELAEGAEEEADEEADEAEADASTDAADGEGEEEESAERSQVATEQRKGARHSQSTLGKMHVARDAQLDACGCPECLDMKAVTADDEGDAASDETAPARVQQARLRRATQKMVAKELAPITGLVTQFRAIAARLAALPGAPVAVSGELPQLAEVRSALAEVKGLVEQIAAQPQAGGPVLHAAERAMSLNAGAMLDPSAPLNRSTSQLATPELVQELQSRGIRVGEEAQIHAAATMISQQRSR